jgi:RNA polymerase sigma factor (sigma-70 family)
MPANFDPEERPADAELVAACLAGDISVFTALIDRHRQRLERLLRALIHDRTARDDVWQETLLRAYFNLEQLRDPARFGAWLCSIAINQARSLHAANRPMTISWEDLHSGDSKFDEAQETPEVMLIQNEMLNRVRQAIADLPPAERATVLLVYLEGLSHKEVAAQLGASRSAVKVRMHRGRRRLQIALGEEFGYSLQQIGTERKMLRVIVQDVLKSIQPPATTAESERSDAPSSPVSSTPASMLDVLLKEERVDQVEPKFVVLLREEGVDRVLPIWVGSYEGESIVLHLKQWQTPRPMTYELFKTVLDLGGIVVERVVIARLHENCFYSNLSVKTGSTMAEVDCRPSDAINLALRLGVPIFVDEVVMTQAGKPLGEPLESEVAWESILSRMPKS